MHHWFGTVIKLDGKDPDYVDELAKDFFRDKFPDVYREQSFSDEPPSRRSPHLAAPSAEVELGKVADQGSDYDMRMVSLKSLTAALGADSEPHVDQDQ
jgi:hypothetical protein